MEVLVNKGAYLSRVVERDVWNSAKTSYNLEVIGGLGSADVDVGRE